MAPTLPEKKIAGRRITSTFVSLLALAVFAPATLAADPVKIGPEIIVSTDDTSYIPRIASDAVGNFMVVWEYDGVMARRFYANGNEHLPQFLISKEDHYPGTTGSTSTGNIDIAGDAVGNFVVTYGATNYEYIYYGYPKCYEGPCVWTRRNDANGETAQPAFVIQDPSTTYVYSYFGGDQVSNPEISSLGNGEFVVVWEGYDKYLQEGGGGYGSDESTFAAKTVFSGQKKGQYFRVNTYDRDYQGQYGDFAADGGPEDGSFVIAFRSEYFEYVDTELPFPGGNIRAQLYDKNGKPVGTEFGTSIDDETYGYNLDVAQAPDGTFMLIWQDDGLQARVFNGDGTPKGPDFEITPDVSEYPAIAASDDSFIVAWMDDEIMGQRFDLTGTAISSEFQINTEPDGYWVDVAAATNGDFIATWLQDSAPRAQRFRVTAPAPIAMPVLGKVAVLTNKIPDNPEKNKGKWKAGGDNIVVPPRGTESDPRCIGHEEGTVKAVVRFWSDDSGHDTGLIPLPCENWSVTGSNTVKTFGKRGYTYSDSKLDAGPCNSVKIKGTKSIAVSCKGKPGVQSFPYDLEAGTGEVALNVMLELGNYRYCSKLPALGFDGSDGKKFRGKNLPGLPLDPCPTGALGQCGNSVIGIDEVCDDGNALDGDYCSADCKTITSVCGDGVAEIEEACDDGNTSDGDYCSGDCSEVTAVCGDSIIGPGEVCDDGNTVGGDYCSANCKTITAVCGDGVEGPGEVCDDGNTLDGDLCSSDCKTETAVCGDGILGPGEVCDDGNTSDGDLCSSDCSMETAICGDGVIGPGEICDDGNTSGGDLCAADCTAVFAICGDSVLSPGECCDDGNTTGGDGCEATCDAGASCPAASPPIADKHRGYYYYTGTHYYYYNTVYVSGGVYNSYFTFSTSGISGTVVGATLRLYVAGYHSGDPSETISIWDVETNPDTVEASHSGAAGQAIFDDLGGGFGYGTFVVASTDVGSILEIPLGVNAIARLNDVLGGDFTVGLAGDTPPGPVRFAYGNGSYVHELVLEVAP